MRNFNVPLMIALLVGVTIFGVGVLLLHQYQLKKNAVVFLDQAKQAQQEAMEARKAKLKENETLAFQTAAQNYRNYLALRPDDVDAREHYALMLLDMHEFGTAYSELERVLRQQPDRSDLRRRLVDMAVEFGVRAQFHPDATERARQVARWFNVAREHLEDYLLKESPDDAQLYELLGRCQTALGKDEEAAEAYGHAIEKAPTQLDAYTRLAGLLRHKLNRPKEGDAKIALMVEKNPDNYLAYLTAGNYQRLNGSLDDAMKSAEKSLELKPDTREGLILAGQCTLARALGLREAHKDDEATAMFDRSRQYIRRGLKEFPADTQLWAAAADIESRSGDMPRAIETLREGLKATDNNPQLSLDAANLLIDSGKLDEARKMLALLRDAQFPEPLKGFVFARMKFAEEKWRDAVEEFDHVRGGMAAFPQFVKQVDYWLGRSYTQLGNSDQAIRAYRRALDNDPFYAPAVAALVEAYINSGQIDAALEVYRQISGRMPMGGLLPAIRMLLLRNLQVRPELRRWADVQRMLDAAAKSDPKSVSVALLQSEVYAAQGNMAQAEQVLKAAHDAAPKSPEIWSAMVSLARRSEDWTKVESLLKDAGGALDGTVDLQLARARYLAQRYGKEALPQLKQMCNLPAGTPPVVQQQVWAGVMNIAMQLGETSLACDLCRKLAELQPNNVQIRFLMFELLLRSGDHKDLSRELTDIERIEGLGPMWHYGKAVELSLQAKGAADPKLDEALEHLRLAGEARPSWSRVALLEAGIYDQQGKVDKAVECYRKAIDRGERNPSAIRRLAQLLFQRRLFHEALDVLGLIEVRPPEIDVEIGRLEGRVLAQLGEFDKALDRARKTAAKSTEFGDHLWLGQLLDAASRRALLDRKRDDAEKLSGEAEAALRRAVELAPQTAETWVQLIRFLVSVGQRDKGVQAVEQAAQKLPADQSALALGQCYEALGDRDQAKQRYEQALAAAPKDTSVIRTAADFYWRTGLTHLAEPLARQIVDGKVPAQASDVSWARRLLAVLMIQQGGDPNLQQAMNLVSENLKADPHSMVDLRMKAGMLASRPSHADRDKAIEIMRTVIGSQAAPTADDQFLLAQLYLSQDDWSRFSQTMMQVIAARGDNPGYLAFYTRQLLQHGELQNADLYIDRLERLAPSQFTTVQLRADLLVRRGQYQSALSMLKEFIDRDPALPASRAERMRLVAETLSLFMQRMKDTEQRSNAPTFAREAEAIYRQYVDATPAAKPFLVGFLARLGRVDAALDLAEQIWSDMPPALLAQELVEFARVPKLTPQQGGRLEKILKEALAKHQRAEPLLLVSGDLYGAWERYAEAEACYREVIDHHEKNAFAMNNLAVMLAMQKRNPDEALRLINTAIQLAGPMPQMLDSRATVYLALGQPEKALQDLERARAEGVDPVRSFHYAQALFETGNKAAAADALKLGQLNGLTADVLQPAERPLFAQLQKDLGQ